MKRLVFLLITISLLGILLFFGPRFVGHATGSGSDAEQTKTYLPEIAPVGATMLDGLGEYSREITTDSPEAQRWFDQAMMLTWGFNHQAAERSFLQALSVDPECAMCWWGAALVLGPHVNAGMDPSKNEAAWERVQAARRFAPGAEQWEQAWIRALAARYASDLAEIRRLAGVPVERRPAAAQVVVVHGRQVVVHQGIAVHHLHSRGDPQRARIAHVEQPGAGDRQERPQALAAAKTGVAHRLDDAPALRRVDVDRVGRHARL